MLSAAVANVATASNAWARVRNPAEVFVLTCQGIGWKVVSAKNVLIHRNYIIDFTRLAPRSVEKLVACAARACSDAKALAKPTWSGPMFWQPIHRLKHNKSGGWTRHHSACLRSSICGCLRTANRFCAAGLTSSAAGKLCGEPDSLCHRKYTCHVWEGARQQYTSLAFREAARQVALRDRRTQECFARGIFLNSECFFPPPLLESELQIQWINRPSDVFLRGNMFIDGSCKFKGAAVQRAGWAVVQVGYFGRCMSADFVAVPFERCPSQCSAAAEDYATYMITQLCTGPLDIYCDNACTVANMRCGFTCTAMTQPRAHLCERWHMECSSDWTIDKTKARASHTDVANGISTAWEKQANDKADELSKRGTDMHRISRSHADDYWGLELLVKEAASWAAQQEVLRSKWKWDGTFEFPESVKMVRDEAVPTGIDFAFRGQLPLQTLEEAAQQEMARIPQQFGHSLLVGEITGDTKKEEASNHHLLPAMRWLCA